MINLRSTDLGVEDAECNHVVLPPLMGGNAVVEEIEECTEDDILTNKTTSRQNKTSRLTAKRKKSERDC